MGASAARVTAPPDGSASVAPPTSGRPAIDAAFLHDGGSAAYFAGVEAQQNYGFVPGIYVLDRLRLWTAAAQGASRHLAGPDLESGFERSGTVRLIRGTSVVSFPLAATVFGGDQSEPYEWLWTGGSIGIDAFLTAAAAGTGDWIVEIDDGAPTVAASFASPGALLGASLSTTFRADPMVAASFASPGAALSAAPVAGVPGELPLGASLASSPASLSAALEKKTGLDPVVLDGEPLDWGEATVLRFSRRDRTGTDRGAILGSREFRLPGTEIGVERTGEGGQVNVAAFRTIGRVVEDAEEDSFAVHVERAPERDVGQVSFVAPPVAEDYDLNILVPPLPSLAAPAQAWPTFEGRGVGPQEWEQGIEIAPVVLPRATGGQGRLSYRITPALPSGVSFDPRALLLVGAPTEAAAEATYVYAAVDEGSQAASVPFTIKVDGGA